MSVVAEALKKKTSNVGLYPYSRDDPLGDFLDALRGVRDLPVSRVLPAHGEPFDDLAGRVDELLTHHAARLDATVAAIGATERDAYAIARTLFPVLRSPHEERFALAETLAHLRNLAAIGFEMPFDDACALFREHVEAHRIEQQEQLRVTRTRHDQRTRE